MGCFRPYPPDTSGTKTTVSSGLAANFKPGGRILPVVTDIECAFSRSARKIQSLTRPPKWESSKNEDHDSRTLACSSHRAIRRRQIHLRKKSFQRKRNPFFRLLPLSRFRRRKQPGRHERSF